MDPAQENVNMDDDRRCKQEGGGARVVSVHEILESGDMPHYYVNGFSCGTANGDVFLIMTKNMVPVFTINLSFTIAKTLSEAIGGLIREIEKRCGHPIITLRQLNDLFSDERNR